MQPGRAPTSEDVEEEACSGRAICQLRQASAAHLAPHGSLPLMHAPWLRQLTLAAAVLAVADCMWGQHNVSARPVGVWWGRTDSKQAAHQRAGGAKLYGPHASSVRRTLVAVEGLAVEGLAVEDLAVEGLAVEGYRQPERGVGRPLNCTACSVHHTTACSAGTTLAHDGAGPAHCHALTACNTDWHGTPGRWWTRRRRPSGTKVAKLERVPKNTDSIMGLDWALDRDAKPYPGGRGGLTVMACANNMACRRDQGPQ